eukprot:361616-Chlamydomonas_euryale.AAC.21
MRAWCQLLQPSFARPATGRTIDMRKSRPRAEPVRKHQRIECMFRGGLTPALSAGGLSNLL